MHWIARLFVVLFAALSTPAFPDVWTDNEIKALPPYCAARMYKDPAKVEYWKEILGPDYLHVHHYCYALGYINRYYSNQFGKKKGSPLTDALGNLDYVIRAFNPSNNLLPEVHMNRGLVLSLQKRSGEAIIEILKAIEMNPKLARAYSMAADHYLKINRKDEALKYITEGLRHNPETKSLQKRYINLGGKTPYPEPVESQKKRPEDTSAVKENAQTVIKEEVKPADGTKAAEAPQADPAKSDNGKGVDDTATAQKIGSPTNPWCRFCPVEPEK